MEEMHTQKKYVAIAFNLEKEISKNQGLDEFYLLINNFILLDAGE
jgi:hypothetical protein